MIACSIADRPVRLEPRRSGTAGGPGRSRAGLDAEHFLGHRPGVHDQRLIELEPLAGCGTTLSATDLLDLRVADDDPLEAVADVDERVVLVGPTLLR